MALTGGTRDFVQEIVRFALQRLHTQPRPGGRVPGSLVFDHPATGRRYAMLIGGHDLVVRCEPAHIASLLTLPGFGPTVKADHDTWMFIKLDGTVDLPTMADYLTSSYAMASQPRRRCRRASNAILCARNENEPYSDAGRPIAAIRLDG
ncbi:hypothetical protein BTHE_1947 [Bifidobacterium thermophilum]|nr:hypothetical protein BTHE_1947 [Bifidobacterium thermophilum]